MSMCEHGFTAMWDCPHCERDCAKCGRSTPEAELAPGTGLCASCQRAAREEWNRTADRINWGIV